MRGPVLVDPEDRVEQGRGLPTRRSPRGDRLHILLGLVAEENQRDVEGIGCHDPEGGIGQSRLLPVDQPSTDVLRQIEGDEQASPRALEPLLGHDRTLKPTAAAKIALAVPSIIRADEAPAAGFLPPGRRREQFQPPMRTGG